MVESIQSVRITGRSIEDWQQLFSGESLTCLENRLLPEFIERQRWFGSKSRHIESTKVADWGVFNEGNSALAVAELHYDFGDADLYLLPLSISFGADAVAIQESFPAAVIVPAQSAQEEGMLHDALFSQEASRSLLSLIGDGSRLLMKRGEMSGYPSSMLPSLYQKESNLRSRLVSTEQSNSSVIYGDTLIMKLFRKQSAGINPDIEIGRYLTDHSSFKNIAPFGGSIEYRNDTGTYAFAMLQGLVANHGDGWEWTLKQLHTFFEENAKRAFPVHEAESFPADFQSLSSFVVPQAVGDCIGRYREAAFTLGRRTGEMHAALGADTRDEGFAPQRFASADSAALQEQMLATAARAFNALQDALGHLPQDTIEAASRVLSWRERIVDRLKERTTGELGGMKVRVHGDYHLGQLLRTESDFVILDFEGEPARTLDERRTKQSPLKDVAGMLRSFSYAAFTGLTRYGMERPEEFNCLEAWAHLWENAVASEFLMAYRQPLAGSSILPDTGFEALLEAFVLDKALYELIYELNNRPLWVKVPLHGILSLSHE
jgi:maltose alpha-D-glucosyltransferase/alpha-amylase